MSAPDAKFLFYGDMINVHRKIDLKTGTKNLYSRTGY